MTEQQKTVAVVIPGGEDGAETVLREVTLIPGTTAQDVLNTLGKGTGFILGTMEGTIFRPRDLVFPSVAESDKLAITPSATAGASAPASRFLREILRFVNSGPAQSNRPLGVDQVQHFVDGPASAPVVIPGKPLIAGVATGESGSRIAGPQPAVLARPSLVATPEKAVEVSPNIQPAWREKGWREVKTGVYEGKFQCPLGSFPGRIEFGRRGFRHTYIWRPPAELWRSGHQKAVCFGSEGGGKYQVHMHDIPRSVDAALLNVERILNEVFELSRGNRYAYR